MRSPTENVPTMSGEQYHRYLSGLSKGGDGGAEHAAPGNMREVPRARNTDTAGIHATLATLAMRH
eukprot:50365-Eustigmatos_ZCMA.PRE.1